MTVPDNDPNVSPNQDTFNDNQTFEIDLDQMYKQFIVAIDNHRSKVNVTNQDTTSLIKAIGGNVSAPTVNNLQPSRDYQESRCHAFYRMIGFPVVSNDHSRFYNPGHDILLDDTRTINLDYKLSVAQNPITGFSIMSLERETYAQFFGKAFSTPNTIDASVLALSGGINPQNIRKFSAPFTNSDDGFDVEPTNQNYTVKLTSKVGEYQVDLSSYQDNNGNTPTGLSSTHSHLIKPFIVDARIDFTVSPVTDSGSAPGSRRVAVPFLPDKRYLKIDGTDQAPINCDPPFLETIITDRFSVENQTDNAGASTQDLITYVKTIPAINDTDLINQISKDDITSVGQLTMFEQYLSIIQTLMVKVVQAQNDIDAAQGLYYWLPVPPANGPEGGCSIQGVILPRISTTDPSKNTDPKLVTPHDFNILYKTAQSILAPTNQNPAVAQTSGQPDTGGFVKSFKNFMSPRSSGAFTDAASQTLSNLSTKRSTILKKASDALRTIEIILGEFSGLGLVDIIAIMAALYVMPKESLLGFLDADAFQRMNTALATGISQPVSLDKAMTDFCSYVKQFYTIMDDVYQDLVKNNGQSSS